MPRGHQGRRQHGRHGQGRGDRILDYGELRHVVLALLSEQPRHGYDIIRAIEQRTGGAYCPSPGVVYPTLAFLQDIGQVRAVNGDGARNRYEITSKGRTFLRQNKDLVDTIASRMQHVGSTQASASPVIVAAMDHLKVALRTGAQPWSGEEAKAVAAAIDAAAERIRELRHGPGQQSERAQTSGEQT